MLRDALSPLAEREFRLLFVGRLVSFIGTAVAPVALAFAVIDDLDGSATELSLVLMAMWLPQIVFVLIGGVIADRLPRHLVLVGSNVLSGCAQLVVAGLLLTDRAELWHLVVAQVFQGVALSFFYPASAGIVPQTVSAGRLQQANALLRMTTTVSIVVGSAAGGLAVAAAGSGWAIAFDGLTYVVSGLVLLFMRITGPVRVAQSFVAELRTGWSEFRAREWLWVIVLAALVGNMVATSSRSVLGPIIADRSLGGAAAWGFILAASAVGLFIGGLVALRFRPRRPLLAGQFGIMLWTLPLAALALELPVWGIALTGLAAGVGIELFGVYWDTTLQQQVPQEALSRVSSYDALGSFVAIPIGYSLVGPVSDAVGIHETLWIAFAISSLALAAAFLSRDVRTLERRDVQVLIGPEPEVEAITAS